MRAEHVFRKEGKRPLTSTKDLFATLQSIHIHSTEYGCRQRVVLLSTSIDSVTSNALPWVWLVNGFPGVSFLLAIRPPEDSNHSSYHTFLSPTTTGKLLRWSFYSVDLLASPYHPMPHARSAFVNVPRIHVNPSMYPRNVRDAREMFLIRQQASHRWNQGYGSCAKRGETSLVEA
jgi:hypothetical protein